MEYDTDRLTTEQSRGDVVKAIGYIRVNTTEQAAEGISLDAQHTTVQAYTVVKDWTLVDVIRDEGVSAKHLKRPGLARLLALVNARQVDVVIVYKLDRLTRSVKGLNSLVELFEKKGVALGEPARKPRRHNRDRPVNDEPPCQCEPMGTRSHWRTHPRCHAVPQGARK
jgi:predicted site-specific integrase-resolvase